MIHCSQSHSAPRVGPFLNDYGCHLTGALRWEWVLAIRDLDKMRIIQRNPDYPFEIQAIRIGDVQVFSVQEIRRAFRPEP